jgi:hypothetical protein
MGNYNALINKSHSFKREVQGPSSIDYRSTPPQWVLPMGPAVVMYEG